MINKLIRYRIVEIIVVIVLVVLTIPIWQRFDSLISKADITTLDDYNLNFRVEKKDADIITINNDYYINKNFKIYLMLKAKDNAKLLSIVINKKEYKLDSFLEKNSRNECIYTLIDDYITAGSLRYEIILKFTENNIKYDYIFEEKSIF